MPTSSLVSNTPFSVIRNDSTPSCVTLVLRFASAGTAAVKSEFNYLDINISDACNPPSVSRISRQQLTGFFNLTDNAAETDYRWDIPVSALPNGESGSKYILSVLEEYNDGSAHTEHHSINFTKSGAPAAPTVILKTLGVLDTATIATSFADLAPVGATVDSKLQSRQSTMFRSSLDQSNGGSPISKIYYTHIYTKEIKKITVAATANINVVNKQLIANLATLTTSAPHNFSVGDTVKVTSVDTIFNGEFIITATDTNTFSYVVIGTNVNSTPVNSGFVKKLAQFILEDQLTRESGNKAVSSSENADGFVDVSFTFPGAKIDSFQSTWVFTENSDGKNSPLSNVIKTTNTNRAIINPSSIASASFDRLDGVSVTLAENFYTQSELIKFSVLAKESTATKYSTTDVINVPYDAAEPSLTNLTNLVRKIYVGSALKDLKTNTVYDFVIVAVKSVGTLAEASDVPLGRNNDVTSLSEISSIVKGQVLAGSAAVLSIATSPTLSSVFTLVRLTQPSQNAGGLNIQGSLSYTPTRVVNNSDNLKNHQYWEMSKITNNVSKVIASDFTQLEGTSPVLNAVLRNLTTFTIPPSELDSESSYKLSVYLALPVLPSMLSVFPSLKDNKAVRANGKNLFFLLDYSSPQSISFKDLIDPSNIDKVHKLSVNSGTDANDNMFLGVCMTHVPLIDDGIEVKKIRFEVSTSDTFLRTFFISDKVLTATDVSSATRFVDVNQASDLGEYQQLYIYEDVEASAATAPSLDSGGTPYDLCPGAAYHVRVSYVCSQVGFQGSTQSSNFSIGSTEFHSEAPPKGPNSVNATANMDTKMISGQYFLPSPLPASLSVQSVRVDLFGSDTSDKSNPLKTMNLIKGPTQTAIPNTFKFDLSNDERQTDSYNIFVTLIYNKIDNNSSVESTPAQTTATFPRAVEIVKYEIVSSSGNPPKTYGGVTEIAGLTSSLRLRVTVSGSVNAVVALLPHSGANYLVLTRVGLTNEWQSDTFIPLQTTLEYEPVIIAVGSNGAGYDLKCNELL